MDLAEETSAIRGPRFPRGSRYSCRHSRSRRLHRPSRDGFAVGGSVRYLRIRYEHDDFPNETTDVTEISPEAIVGYQWHPLHGRFYLQPWLALGVALSHSARATVGTHTYHELPVSPFFTVNIGWEQRL